VERLNDKPQTTYSHLRDKIDVFPGDMACFNPGKKFELIIIPWRALQWLPVREKTISCLKCVRDHLTDNGLFVFDIFKPGIYDEKWIGKEDISYDITDGNRRIIRSTVNHFADTSQKYIQYKNKIRILEAGKETVKEDMLFIKYYEHKDIVDYDKRSIADGDEMIFMCTK
jgi:hypothetical protein